MNAKQKRDIYTEVTDRIVAALENGTVPWRRPWSATGGPHSLDGRNYRGINIFLLELMGYGDPRWGTFKAVKRHGGNVRKGEKGTRVILWKPIPKKDEKGEADGSYLLLRDYVVFNAEQCDDIEPLPVVESDITPNEAADAIVAEYTFGGPIVQYGKSGAYYVPATDKIGMPNRETFVSTDAHYSTLFHELVHSTGHESRLKRIEVALFGTDNYSREELVAEMGAAMLCGLTGIDNQDQSAAYIEGWLKPLQNDRKFVVQAAAKAQKAVDLMIGTTFDKDTDDETAATTAAVS